MFENGFFGLFKTSQQEEPRTQQPTWNPNTMAMEQPSNYAGSQDVTSQEQQQMKLRGGNDGCCDVCCGCCAGICAIELCECCC